MTRTALACAASALCTGLCQRPAAVWSVAWPFCCRHVYAKMEGCERPAGPQLAGPVPATAWAGAGLRQLNMAGSTCCCGGTSLSELGRATMTQYGHRNQSSSPSMVLAVWSLRGRCICSRGLKRALWAVGAAPVARKEKQARDSVFHLGPKGAWPMTCTALGQEGGGPGGAVPATAWAGAGLRQLNMAGSTCCCGGTSLSELGRATMTQYGHRNQSSSPSMVLAVWSLRGRCICSRGLKRAL